MACGAGAVKAEAVANKETKNAAWVMSLLAREQVHFSIPLPVAGGERKEWERKKRKLQSPRHSFTFAARLY